MINSRDINKLHPFVQAMCRQHIDYCRDVGITIIVTATLRDYEYQNYLYAQGRTRPGKRVTNARGGFSLHNFGVAYDVVPTIDGHAIWNTNTKIQLKDDSIVNLWQEIGRIGEFVGLEWGGNWKSFVDMPHFQYTQGLTLADFRNGKMIT